MAAYNCRASPRARAQESAVSVVLPILLPFAARLCSERRDAFSARDPHPRYAAQDRCCFKRAGADGILTSFTARAAQLSRG